MKAMLVKLLLIASAALVCCTSGEQYPHMRTIAVEFPVKTAVLPALLVEIPGKYSEKVFDADALNAQSPIHRPGASQQNERIVGGFAVNITRVPWQVGLSYFGQQTCGGSIIGSRWILTAAHCLTMLFPLRYKVRVGTDDRKGGQLHGIRSYKIHQRYGEVFVDFDFGLIELKEPLAFSDRIRPVALPNAGDEHMATGTTCLVSGWGVTHNWAESTRYLRAVEVPTVDQQLCNQVYEGKVTERMFCAGLYEDGGKDGECVRG